ncbi:MAG: AAA family ATPase [Planctomycetes bacterium]|nr:AAA family ATPase [Planctomycetota bacterium]
MSGKQKIVMIAGPNGAGKTTFAREFLVQEANCPDFINADLIAAGLSPFQPQAAAIRAGRLMLEEIDSRVRENRSFAFETTLSGRMYARRIPAWRRQGYRVKLICLRLDSVELAIHRVAARVAQGGHDIPEPVIRRRFEAGRRNFEQIYKSLVDAWAVYDNSGELPRLIETGGSA